MKPTRLPPRRKKHSVSIWKSVIVLGGAIILTTLGIEASDTFRIPGSGMLAGVGSSAKEERCPAGMVFISNSGGGYCIDRYEASAGEFCGHKEPVNQFETNENIAQEKCRAESVTGKQPWVNVSLHQAVALCARVGKHLASPEEWYRAALGTPDTVSKDKKFCALGRTGQSRADKTGAHSGCVSSYGAYDMVGNVWEWVDAEIADGTYKGRTLPDEGFVADADLGGVPIATGNLPQEPFGGDQWFLDRTGVRAMFRGGFWSIGEKAGVYAINATIQPSFIGVAVGFRCVQ